MSLSETPSNRPPPMDLKRPEMTTQKSEVKQYRSNTNISKLKDKIRNHFHREHWAYAEDIYPTVSAPDNQSRLDKKYNKRFWTFIRHNKQDSISTASIENPKTGRLETKPTQKAQILNQQFQAVFSRSTPAKIHALSRYDTMQEFNISTKRLLKIWAPWNPMRQPALTMSDHSCLDTSVMWSPQPFRLSSSAPMRLTSYQRNGKKPIWTPYEKDPRTRCLTKGQSP